MSVQYDVAIIGLGPTGATLANLCGAAGLRTVVYERDPAPYSQPRACHLDAEIARVFQQLGFEQELRGLITVSAGMEYVDPTGATLFSFEGFEREPLLGWHEDYVFVQPQVEAMLRRGLERFAHVTVHLGVEAPPPDVLLADARYVVACDGAASPTRETLGIRMLDLQYHEPWLVVDVRLHDTSVPPLPSIIQQVCDPARLSTFVPSHAEYRRWEFLLHGDEHPDPWRLLAPWGVTPSNAELVRAARYRFHALVADGWRGGPDDRVFLAGDAAHMMPPFMGQGMCSGIRDAVNLAWKFAESRETGDDVELLATYEPERRPHAEAVVRMSIEAGRTLSRLAADPTDLPTPDTPDPSRWSRLPGLHLGGEFPVGHLLPQPDRLDDHLPDGWVWVAADPWFDAPDGRMVVVEPRATYGEAAVLVRPDRYIAAVSRST